ncbi:TetR/AcrR family transcriptional regulator [Janthinobacterium aquaticum]|uniref:TetR/AcrR family transcriptional regulator n=1 Tax=Janthinobacterium sp. FT58W TaxID=2654254 RepID=UPI00126539F2|nr:TetR/AcrR family transcriptional regulator [Janthinobacterium sp. FT58W]KAB8042510.1 TetR family transcriptional regulator [Janthinobacterium sp. FT58W]
MDKKLSNIQERKVREAHARREHIIEVVKRLIKQGGARAVSIRKVAEAAGFSTTVVYALFRDKATLIAQAMDKDLLDLVGAMRSASEAQTDPWDRVRSMGRAYIQYGFAHPDEYALIFMELRPHAEVDAAMVEHGNAEQDPYAYALQQFAALAEAGQVQAEEAALHAMTQIFWQSLHGLVSLRIVMDEGDPWTPYMALDAHTEDLLSVVTEGIRLRFAPSTKIGVRSAIATQAHQDSRSD